jgi:hypothetical protein
VIIDGCTRWVEVVIIEDISTNTIIQALFDSWIAPYPIPEIIHTDKGTQFVSNDFKRYLETIGVRHSTTIGDNPQGNSICERVNATIGNILRIYKGYELRSVVSLANNSLRLTYHRTLKCTPTELVFGCKKFYRDKRCNIKKLFERYYGTAEKEIKKTKNKANTGRSKIGLLNKNIWIRKNTNEKLQERNKGPYKVVEECKDKGIVCIEKNVMKRWISVRKISHVEG